MLPEHLAAVLDAKTWEVPEVLKWLKRSGSLTEVRVFDCLRFGASGLKDMYCDGLCSQDYRRAQRPPEMGMLTPNSTNRPNSPKPSTQDSVW